MRKIFTKFIILPAVLWVMVLLTAAAQSAEQPVVRAVLFYSPACAHCHAVITEVLLPMQAEYGSRLQIMAVDTTQSDGQYLYQLAIDRFQIPPHRFGVPTLIVGDTVLVGSEEIPQQFPALVERELAAGGAGWPDVAGLNPADPSAALTPVADVLPLMTISPEEAWDPVGITLAGIILGLLVTALGFATWRLTASWQVGFDFSSVRIKTWLIPALALVGLGIAIYLAYIEITHAEAVCGPVGDCNRVQASAYAQIMGIPVAVLGILNYVGMAILWAGHRFGENRLSELSLWGLLAMTLAGTLFSIYLTWVEIFIIRAVCIWCLSSAVITVALLFLVLLPATGANEAPANAGAAA